MTAFISLGEEGAAEEFSTGDIPGGAIDLGGGHKLELSSEQFREILHSAAVVQAIQQRAQGVADECNQTKKKKRAVYEVLVQNEPSSSRARAFVKPGNADAYYDDAVNSTMLKAAANAPNDPKMTGTESDASGIDLGVPIGDVAEAGEAAEVADLAEIALVAL